MPADLRADPNGMTGVRGRLVTTAFVRDQLWTLPGTERPPARFRRDLDIWSARWEASIGPASGVRAIAEGVLSPLVRMLGFVVAGVQTHHEMALLPLHHRAESPAAAVAVGWNAPLGQAWRTAVSVAIAGDVRWCFCTNGTALRIVDARRTWAREHLEFDLAALTEDDEAQALLWAIARADALTGAAPVLDRAVALSARHGVDVCRDLGRGVLEALQLLLDSSPPRQRPAAGVLFEHALTVLYRVLFLLFAEARGLVPTWHQVYRDRYSLETIVATLLSRGRYRGLWPAIQAISRLAHAGCAAGELRVTAFNGRLFSPSQTSAFDNAPIPDEAMGRAIVLLSTTKAARRRIAYRDLDVEQLGAVYEQVLDYQPAPGGDGHARLERGDARKASGSFYTPRAVTAALVRRTLEPLVAGRSADDILRLKLLDPAMGSGAFLVAACRFLAGAAEDALVREGQWHAGDVTAADRIQLRRDVASRCLFGVDLNPMAVQLGRLSLWLATLASGQPLSFLDHHLVAGNSLIGATPEDVQRQPPGGGRPIKRAAALPLFGDDTLRAAIRHGVATRLTLSTERDASVSVVRAKEQSLARLRARGEGLERWTRLLDLWCAGWFWQGAPLDRRLFPELADEILRDRSALPAPLIRPMLAEAEGVAARHRFLHWPLVFPEVFADEHGDPRADPGFDAILGNPPWDMVRGDSGPDEARRERRADAQRIGAFVRDAGIYQVETRAHANSYQLFVERALQLVRRGGRIGLVVPGGIATDTGAAALRRHLFDRAAIDELTGFDNSDGIFPIHRSVRFVLLSCTAGRPTEELRCRFGIRDPGELERADASTCAPLVITRRFLARLSGDDDLGVPEIASAADLAIVERVSAAFPRLGSADGWQVEFGRELNASDDRDRFAPYRPASTARPVVEGKQIEPFRTTVDRCTWQLRDGVDVGRRAPRRARLAYRDVASATNRLTLIAAIVPARAVTTHTLFCLKTPLPADSQHALCALMNSFVANYLIRMRVNTHVTVSLVSRLRVPAVREGDPSLARLASLSRRLAAAHEPIETLSEYAELQALAAQLYGCSAQEFEHILGTFPLVSANSRSKALEVFEDLHVNGPRRH